MKKDNFIRRNLRLILYLSLVLVLTIYLGISVMIKEEGNQIPPQVVQPGGVDENPVEDEIPESDQEIADIEEPDNLIPDEDFDDVVVGEIKKENRLKTLEEDVNEIDNHTKIISSEMYDLFLQEENLSIILRDRSTGSLLYSTVKEPDKSNEQWQNFIKSGVVVEYLKGTNIVNYQADMYTGNPSKEIKISDKGFTARVNFEELGFEYTLSVQLDKDKLIIEIPRDSIVETSDQNKIANIYVYPFMGYTKMDEEEGYLFIPDGSGATMNFEDNKGEFKQPYSEMVYGANIGIDDPYVLSLFNGMNTINEAPKIMMPVYGSNHSEKEIGFLGIIESGDESVRIEAYPNGAILPYNWVTPKFIYRQFYNQLTSQSSGTMVVRQEKLNEFDIKININLLSKENTGYVGMAKKYREYLEEKDVFSKEGLDYNMKIDFLGSELEDGLISKKDIAMTSFEQAQEIFAKLNKSGVNNIFSVFKGWMSDGVYGGLPITDIKVNKALGGGSGLESLLHYTNKNDIKLMLETDLLKSNPATTRKNKYSLVKKLNKREFSEPIYGNVFNKLNYLIPEESHDNSNKILKALDKNNMNELAITGISNNLFSYLTRGKTYDRVHTKNIYDSIFEAMKESSTDLALESPFAPFWQYSDNLYDLPLEPAQYVFVDKAVPFMQIALKGNKQMYTPYVNFNANQEENLLRMVEYGMNPSFILTYQPASLLQHTNSSDLYSTNFEQYSEQISDYDKIFKSLHEDFGQSKIIDHRQESNVSVVKYDNNKTIVVNYGDKTTQYKDVNVEGNSFEVIDE